MANGFGRGHETIWCRDDFVSGTNSKREQSQPERVGPIPYPDGMSHPAEGAKLALEICHERTTGKGAPINYLRDCAVQFRAQRSMLSLKIEKRNRHQSIS